MGGKNPNSLPLGPSYEESEKPPTLKLEAVEVPELLRRCTRSPSNILFVCSNADKKFELLEEALSDCLCGEPIMVE
jgi:hypothetical protein